MISVAKGDITVTDTCCDEDIVIDGTSGTTFFKSQNVNVVLFSSLLKQPYIVPFTENRFVNRRQCNHKTSAAMSSLDIFN